MMVFSFFFVQINIVYADVDFVSNIVQRLRVKKFEIGFDFASFRMALYNLRYNKSTICFESNKKTPRVWNRFN